MWCTTITMKAWSAYLIWAEWDHSYTIRLTLMTHTVLEVGKLQVREIWDLHSGFLLIDVCLDVRQITGLPFPNVLKECSAFKIFGNRTQPHNSYRRRLRSPSPFSIKIPHPDVPASHYSHESLRFKHCWPVKHLILLGENIKCASQTVTWTITLGNWTVGFWICRSKPQVFSPQCYSSTATWDAVTLLHKHCKVMKNATHTAVLAPAAHGIVSLPFTFPLFAYLQLPLPTLPMLNPLPFSSLDGCHIMNSPSLNMQCPLSVPLVHMQTPSTPHWLAHHLSSQSLTYTFPLSTPR
jgi:hypothetical protein